MFVQAFVLAFVLATGKTEEIYVLILDHLKTKAARLPNASRMKKKKVPLRPRISYPQCFFHMHRWLDNFV